MPTTTPKSQRRRVPRDDRDRSVVRIELKDGQGNSRWVTGDLVDRSEHGLGVTLMAPLKPGISIQVIGKLGEEGARTRRQATVNWCREASNGAFRVGLEFPDARSGPQSGPQVVSSDPLELDCYELMQLSPNAES